VTCGASTAVRARAFGVSSFHGRCGAGVGVVADASVRGLVFLLATVTRGRMISGKS